MNQLMGYASMWTGMFLVTFLIDFVRVRYISAVDNGNVLYASHWAATLLCLTSVATMSFVKDPVLLAPMILGAWLGTYCSQKWKATKAQQDG